MEYQTTLSDLVLSANCALWGQVVPNLRAFSIEASKTVIKTRAVFDKEPTEHDIEMMSMANSEIIADFPEHKLDEQYLTTPSPNKAEHLEHLVFMRYEPECGY